MMQSLNCSEMDPAQIAMNISKRWNKNRQGIMLHHCCVPFHSPTSWSRPSGALSCRSSMHYRCHHQTPPVDGHRCLSWSPPSQARLDLIISRPGAPHRLSVPLCLGRRPLILLSQWRGALEVRLLHCDAACAAVSPLAERKGRHPGRIWMLYCVRPPVSPEEGRAAAALSPPLPLPHFRNPAFVIAIHPVASLLLFDCRRAPPL